MILADLQQLATEISAAGPDPRPRWLRDLPEAEAPGTRYYWLLWRISQRLAPCRVLEIGTYKGTSAAHLSNKKSGHLVVTVDANPDASVQVRNLGLDGIVPVTADSAVAFEAAAAHAPFDVLFVDATHDFNHAYGEYFIYRDLVRDGGIMLFDDVALEMATNEMEIFWSYVVDPKFRADDLHSTGFGIAVKDGRKEVPPWKSIIKEASLRMAIS